MRTVGWGSGWRGVAGELCLGPGRGEGSPAGPGGEGPQLTPLWNINPTCSSQDTVGVSGSR